MILSLDIYEPADFPVDWWKTVEQVLGPGAFDDVDFIVYWRKYKDAEYNGMRWDGWPFRRDVGSMYRVDDPDNWKNTWFLFTHA